MTFDERVERIAALGFTPRQAAFLVTVMLHSGVCVERQYCRFAGIVHGQNSRGLFDRLVHTGDAVAHEFRSKHQGRLYHIRHKRLYATIAHANSRHRKWISMPRAVERLMVLDAVLADRSVMWLATEVDKVAMFARLLELCDDRHELPHTASRASAGKRRFFPDTLPIGVGDGGFRYVFLYLVNRSTTYDFRDFLMRHAPLLSRLPHWTVRLVVPRPFAPLSDLYAATFRDQLATSSDLRDHDELRWYFDERRRRATTRGPSADAVRYTHARRRFRHSTFRARYRAWCQGMSEAIDRTSSDRIAEALRNGTATLEIVPLTHQYLHLAASVGRA